MNYVKGVNLNRKEGVCLKRNQGVNLVRNKGVNYNRKQGVSLTGISIQPNPANNNIIISMIESEENIQSYEIRDILGKLVTAKEFNNYNRSEHINTSDLAVGLYLIYVTSSFGKSSTQKFVIQH